MSLYSVVIPVYKSTESLRTIASEIEILGTESGFHFEIIFVNDSPNYIETERTLAQLGNKYGNVRVVTLRKNQGQQIATLAGMTKANGDYIITMDDDLQHPVKEIPKLIKAMASQEHLEGIFALPNYRDRKHSMWRTLGSYLLKKIDRIFIKKPRGLVLSSFRIMTKDLSLAILKSYNSMPVISNIMVSCTDNLKNIKVEHASRGYGKTNYTLSKLITLALNGILFYSSLPLKVIGVVGFFGFIGSLLFVFLTIVRKILIDIEVPGYASTVSLISFFGGLNLFAIGLVGEYLIRVIKEQQKPRLEDLIK